MGQELIGIKRESNTSNISFILRLLFMVSRKHFVFVKCCLVYRRQFKLVHLSKIKRFIDKHNADVDVRREIV